MNPGPKRLLLLFSAICWISGNLLAVFYLRASYFVSAVFFMVIFAGMASAFLLLFRKHIPPRSISKEEKAQWPASRQAKGIALIFAFMFLVVLNIQLTKTGKETWRWHLLEKGPSVIVKAFIYRMNAHSGKHTTYYYPVARYYDGKKFIEQEFQDEKKLYRPGDSVQLIYLVESPEVMNVLQKAH